MSITVNDLQQLDPDAVLQEEELLAESVQELLPSTDMKRGVIRDTVIHIGAILGTKNQTEQTRLRQSNNVHDILADPTLADDDTVDNIASNYRVTRVTGSNAAGHVTVVVSSLRDVTIAVGTVFEAQGKSFTTPSVFTARSNASNVVTAADRVLTARGDGNYEFQISVVAADIGVASQLNKGASLVPKFTPANFVQAFATSDFTQGLDAEDNQALLDRFVNGMSAKVLSSRDNMSSLLRENFPGMIDDSIIGYGDGEMLRDRHTIFPVASGGRVDWYVRSQLLHQTVAGIKTALLIDIAADGYGIWQLSFSRDEYPGFYDVAVLPLDVTASVVGTFPIVSTDRGTDLTALDCCSDFVPDIATPIEAAFSRFQTMNLVFKDILALASPSAVIGTTTADYRIDVRSMPLIADMQDFVSQRSFRNAANDVLLKAPVPCFIQLPLEISLAPGQLEPDPGPIANALSSFVNTYGFTGRLPASSLYDIIHNFLPPRASVSRLDMIGRMILPNGRTRVLHSTDLLEIPSLPDIMVTGRTTALLLRADDVTISFITVDLAEV